MAKYASVLNNCLFLICANDENKFFFQSLYQKDNISFIPITDEQFNIIKYDERPVSISNNQLIFGEYPFEPENSLIEQGKPPIFKKDTLWNKLQELINYIEDTINKNKINIYPNEWKLVLSNLKMISYDSIPDLVRATNWVKALEVNNINIRGYKEL